jgi:hypothetical protein
VTRRELHAAALRALVDFDRGLAHQADGWFFKAVDWFFPEDILNSANPEEIERRLGEGIARWLRGKGKR